MNDGSSHVTDPENMEPSRPHRSARNGGYALMEMMGVILIFVLMLSIGIPAIHKSREAARRAQCFNNLKQLSLAMSLYESNHRVLAPGVVNPTGPIDDQRYDHHLGFIPQLLPYLEQHSVYRVICQEASIYDAANTTVRRCRIGMLLCPDDPVVKTTGQMNLNGGSVGRATRPMTIGQMGFSSYAACHHDLDAPIDTDNHGVFFLNSTVTIDDIGDGTSNTIFFGEKLITPLDLGWMSGTRATLRNTGTPINRTEAARESGLYVGGFASRHPGGANFAFGDGSVRFVKETIDPIVYQHLGHRSDGELVGGDSF